MKQPAHLVVGGCLMRTTVSTCGILYPYSQGYPLGWGALQYSRWRRSHPVRRLSTHNLMQLILKSCPGFVKEMLGVATMKAARRKDGRRSQCVCCRGADTSVATLLTFLPQQQSGFPPAVAEVSDPIHCADLHRAADDVTCG